MYEFFKLLLFVDDIYVKKIVPTSLWCVFRQVFKNHAEVQNDFLYVELNNTFNENWFEYDVV